MSKNFEEFEFDEPVNEEDLGSVEVVEEVEEVKPKKNQNGSKASKKQQKLRVAVIRTYVYDYPDQDLGYLAPVMKGTQLDLVKEHESGWLEVSLPRAGGSVVGFIKESKVTRI